jgi:hypothetical protein
MALYFIKKSIFVFALLCSTFARAHNIDDTILCPSVDIIQLSSKKIDSAQKINNKYIAYTATSVYQINNLWWFVGVGDIFADSSNEAIVIGKEIAREVSTQENVYAIKQGSEYICKYWPGYIQARGKDLSFTYTN